MTQDVRAYVYCSLGEVISGEITESSVVDSGLITVSGSVVLSGVYAPQRGSTVQLSYYKQGTIGRIGRKLRVLGYYANPVTRTTEVSIGCYLTYHSDTQPAPVTLSSQETDDNLNLSELDKLALLNPTRAATVFKYCCDTLGISYDSIPLTNQFFRENFDLDGNYISLMSDLLKSENYIGYLDSSERLKFIHTPTYSTNGPVLQETNIIDISPIQSDLIPADYVYSTVPYRRIKLDDAVNADFPQEQRTFIYGSVSNGDLEDTVEDRSYPYTLSGWERNDILSKREYRYEHPQTKEIIVRTLFWTPITDWTAYYDAQGRVERRVEYRSGLYGTYFKVDTTTYGGTGEGYEYQREVSVEGGPAELLVEACGLPEEVMVPLPNGVPFTFYTTYSNGYVQVTQGAMPGISDLANAYWTEGWDRKSIRITESTPYSVETHNYQYQLAVNTSDGAQGIKNYMESYKDNPSAIDIGLVFEMADDVVLTNATHTFETKKPEYKINDGQGRDYNSSPDNEVGRVGDQADRAATYSTEVENKIEILYSQQPKGIILEFTPPYLSDDKITKVGDLYRVTASDAPQKARAYASIQNKFRLGQINGQSVVLPIEYVPATPFGTIYLDFNGVVGAYKYDNVSIAFDNTGILFSADCLFWGGVGQ